MQSPAQPRSPGPLERTSLALWHIQRAAAFRRRRRTESRALLLASDGLVDAVEGCRLRGLSLLPTPVWMHVVRFVGAVNPSLRDALGINRHPDHVMEVVFAAQAELMARAVHERLPRQAEIIPLFPEPLDEPAGAAG